MLIWPNISPTLVRRGDAGDGREEQVKMNRLEKAKEKTMGPSDSIKFTKTFLVLNLSKV